MTRCLRFFAIVQLIVLGERCGEALDDEMGLMQDTTNLAQVKFATRASKLQEASQKEAPKPFDSRAVVNEFIAMALFVVIGCGSAMVCESGPCKTLQVALTFGLAITALASATGGQINCAVTLGLFILGELSGQQAVANVAAQLLGSVLGAGMLGFIFAGSKDGKEGKSNDETECIGSNVIAPAFNWTQALVGEIVMTFLLMYVVCQTAVVASQPTATMSIGFAVFLAHSVLIPIDGCSINPTRSFGPALVASFTGTQKEVFKHMPVFWVGPLVGAALAASLVRTAA